MLDIKQVRKDPQSIAEALQKKRYDFPLDEFVRLDSRRKGADVRSQDLLAERKKASKQVGALIAQGKSIDEAKAEVNETLDRLSTELDAAVEEGLGSKVSEAGPAQVLSGCARSGGGVGTVGEDGVLDGGAEPGGFFFPQGMKLVLNRCKRRDINGCSASKSFLICDADDPVTKLNIET
ncbi:MAG: hypothetical protein EBU35_06170 [Marivivens sp.]|nr:hypothetical protein [Marivivens sp.]